MKILKTLNLAYLQTLTHILTEMERVGVSSLAEARAVVYRETEAKHLERRKLLTRSKPEQRHLKFEICPKCGHRMVSVKTEDSDLEIHGCVKCRYSHIVDGLQ